MDPAIKEKMNSRIRQVIKERSGPSFEERVAARSAKLQKETKVLEDSQMKVIKAAVAKAKARPIESPVRPKHMVPASIEQWGKEHARTRRENEARYADEHAARKNRMDTREPLFKLEDVKNAFEMQKQRIKENKQRMTEDENKRWEHLQELQKNVLNRPLLVEDPAGASKKPQPDEQGHDSDPNWKDKFQATMHRQIKQTIKERTGPSFEQRVKQRSQKLRKETKVLEDSQQRVIDAALERAKARPCESAQRPKELIPTSIEEWGKEHARTRAENEAAYAQQDAERRHRMKTREPLFKVSEVKAAFEMQEKRQKENRRRLAAEEAERWAMLQSMQERVIDRPMLVESYERPVHQKSEIEPRLVPDHTKDLAMTQSIKKCVSLPSFKESAWGKEVEALRQRMDQRPKLHEIPYPPKTFPDKPPPPKMVTALDQRLAEVMNQSWFKSCEWASSVKEIKQRQDDRPRLHEISYPPKH